MHRDGDIYSIAVSNDLVLTGSSSHRIHAWKPLDCHAKGYIHASSGEVRAMVAHGEVLFTSHKDHKIRVWNMKDCSGNSSSSSFRPRKLTTLPNDSHFKKIISRPIAPQIKGTSKPIIIPQHRDTISCMAYYHVEGILYTGSFDRTVKAWRVNEKKCVDSFIAHGGNINDMVVNQQNGYLITCSSDGTVKMWLRVYGENSHALIRVLVFHAYPFHALAFSVAVSNKSFLYSGSTDGTINYWEQEISCRYTHGGFLQGHRFAVLSLVTIENIVISGSEDSTIRIWKREKGRGNIHECLAVLEGHRGPVRCLATFLQKDKFALSFLVYTASLDQTFKAWRVKLSPEVKKSPFGDDDDDDDDREESKSQMEFETSPVLSPSWVKKKLQISRSLHKLV
ncbi:protein JINGUBANG-like [Chenopodium quinoa]|uniref:protein JINGUBANG-like n=1 Tax=Chenopodium quinoa TaxID=63459 RepID=UPI000B771D2E|nr:protein JINGUBANG-like [Chenopodium quinoa]